MEELYNIFSQFKSNDDKWKYLLDLSRQSLPIDPELKKDQFLVPGCSTSMYFVPKFENNRLYFYVDLAYRQIPSISLGLAIVIKNVYSDKKPSEIIKMNPEFFKGIGLTNSLTSTRANGFASMIDLVYRYANYFKSLEEK